MPMYRYCRAAPDDAKVHIRDVSFTRGMARGEEDGVPAVVALCGASFVAESTGPFGAVPTSADPLCTTCNGIARP